MTSEKLLHQLMKSPEIAVEHLDLEYVDNTKLSISRFRNEKGFTYKNGKKLLKNQSHLERISRLVIPPAWDEVKITHLPNGHLQAVGNDSKNRKQYRYHPTWTKVRNQTKFYKMSFFGKKLPVIRKKVEKDLAQSGWPKSKVIALVLQLMEETHIRIGNEQYAKRNKSYGLSTMRKKHVDIHRNNMKFEFIGKKGKEHSVTVRNKKLIHLVSRCEEIPGWELFKYFDEDGQKQTLNSTDVNEYLHANSGEFFTAKDFRTWAASVVFFDTLLDIGTTEDPKENHGNILKGFDAAAKALGNTRNVCRKYYVHPLLVSSYEDGSLDTFFKMTEEACDGSEHFSASEAAMLELFGKYNPLF
ncbi:DNA topoisomerase IB [Maribacter sp. 2307UL18-2]|uniref:DNA topoisomerase IB n=1 Tax=Maribacter sp. 2307UL18-2 TaxID=3386274 RepID=UPI0039BD25BC